MSLSMLKQNVEMLRDVSENYYKLLERKKLGENVETQINNLKNQMVFLQAGIKKLLTEEKNG